MTDRKAPASEPPRPVSIRNHRVEVAFGAIITKAFSIGSNPEGNVDGVLSAYQD